MEIVRNMKFSTVSSKTSDKKKKNSGFDERKAETEALNKFLTIAEQARRF